MAITMWRGSVDDVNNAVLEIGRERWSRERSRGLAFDHAIKFCLEIDFSRPAVKLEISGVTPGLNEQVVSGDCLHSNHRVWDNKKW